jgi:hypothetical protein
MKGASYDYTTIYLELILSQTRLQMAGVSEVDASFQRLKRVRRDLDSANDSIRNHFDQNLFKSSDEWEDDDPDLGD